MAACLPDPASLGDKMTGKTCAGLFVTGKGKDGQPRATYYYHVVDNEWSMKEYGIAGGGLADGHQPRDRDGAACQGHMERHRGCCPRRFRRQAIPEPARRWTPRRATALPGT